MRPRIIFINQSLGPLFVELLESLASSFGSCILITGSYPDQQRGQLTVRRAPRYSKKSAWSRLRTWAAFLVFAAFACLTQRGRPALFVTTNPPFLPFLAYLLHRLRHWEYTVLVWDIYPDVIVRFTGAAEKSWLVRLWRFLNRKVYLHASSVVSIGEEMALTLRAKLPDFPSENMQLIPNWANTHLFRPIAKADNPFVREHGLEAAFVVMYSGNMGATHDLDTLMAAAARLHDRADIRFVLIGSGAARKAIEESILRNHLGNVLLLPKQPEQTFPFSLAAGDVAVVSLGRGAEGLSMPSKTYPVMAVGSAVIGITHTPSDLARTIAAHRIGASVSPGDVEGLVAEILHCKDDADYLKQCQSNARRAAEQYYCSERILEKYKSLLEPMVVA